MIDNSILDELIKTEIPGEPFNALDRQRFLKKRAGTFLDKLGNVWFDEDSLRRFITNAPFLRLYRDLDTRVITLPLNSGPVTKNYFRDDLVADLIQIVRENANNTNAKEIAMAASAKILRNFERNGIKKKQADAREEMKMLRDPVDAVFQKLGTDAYTKDNPGGSAILNLGTCVSNHNLNPVKFVILWDMGKDRKVIKKEWGPNQEKLKELEIIFKDLQAPFHDGLNSLKEQELVSQEDQITEKGSGVFEDIWIEIEKWIEKALHTQDKVERMKFALANKFLGGLLSHS